MSGGRAGLAGRLARGAFGFLGGLVLAGILWVALYAVVPVIWTPLMTLRALEGAPPAQVRWVPLDRISPALVHAVIGAKDSRFCAHDGIDWPAVRAAWTERQEGGRLRGGSTISMQVAKNAFLWPERSWLRKGLEAWFTLWVELFWPKSRVMEVYLNIAEWGDGIYGAEAAARAHFGKAAADLSRREAALLAAVLPSPRRWSVTDPGPYVRRRAALLEQRAAIVRRDGLAACVVERE